VKGRAAIEALWAGAIKQNWKNVTLTALSVERYGNAAREIGRFTLDAPDPQQKLTHIEGKYANMSWCGRRRRAAGSSIRIFGI
jgi:hypothetical protein